MVADVNLGIKVDKKGDGDKEAALGLEVVAKAANNAKDNLAQLDRKLLETRAAMVAAGKTFTQTGDISPFKQLLKDQRELNSVRKVLSNAVTDAEKDVVRLAKVGEQGAAALGKGMEDALPGVLGSVAESIGKNPEMAAGIAASIVVGAPLIGAALGTAIDAAVISGVGFAGIGTGIALHIKDPAVQSALDSLKTDIKTTLTSSTYQFGPALATGFHAFEKEALSGISDIGAGINSLAPYAANLGEKLGEAASKLGPGLESALTNAGPVIARISADLPQLASDIGRSFEIMGQGGKGAGELIHVAMVDAGVAIKLVGIEVLGAEKAFEGFVFLGDKVFGELEKTQVAGTQVGVVFKPLADGFHNAAHAMDDMDLSADNVSTSFSALAGKIAAGAESTDVLIGQMADKFLSATLGLDQATLGFAQSQTQLGDVLKTNYTLQDISTVKGQQLREAVLGVVSANISEYDAMIRAGAGADEASAAYDANTAALADQLRQAGLTGTQVDTLVGKYRNVPANVDTDVAMHGLTDAINDLDDAIRLANGLDGRRVDVTIDTLVRTTHQDVYIGGGMAYNKSASAFGAKRYGDIVAAAGGAIVNSPTILFGERGTGLEAYIPKLGISDTRGLALADQAARWHGGRVVSDRHTVAMPSRPAAPPAQRQPTVTFAGNLDSAMATAFMRMIREGLIQISA